MQDIQTPRKPRAKRTVKVADLLQGIAKAGQQPEQNTAGALAFLSGWVKQDHPELGAALFELTKLRRV